MGLRLSPAKTQVVHMGDGFDFLGFRIRWKRKRGTNKWRVETNQAAEFPTMLPHAIGSAGGPAEILGIFDRRGHQDRDEPSAADRSTR
jgi:hypothetical protein